MGSFLQFYHYYFQPVQGPWWQGAVWGNLVASALLSVSILFTIYKTKLKCSSCWRPAHHPVKGTHYRTCHKHSTIEHHKALQAKHKLKHPEEHKLLASIK